MVRYVAIGMVRLGVWALISWAAAAVLISLSPATGIPCHALGIAAVVVVVVALVAGYTSGPRWLSQVLPLGPLGRDGRRRWRAARLRGDHAKMARRLAWRWPTIMANSGLATKDATSSRAKASYPDVLEFREIPKGLKLTVEPIAQVPASEIAAHADNIAAALKVIRCEVNATSSHLIELTLVDRDPLGEVNQAEWDRIGTVAPQHLGVTDDGHPLVIDLRDPWHIAIQGMSRSGKSVLTYNLLAPLATCDNVLVCGVDPTQILLSPWRGYPGDEFRHLGGDAEAAAKTLASLCRAMDLRIQGLVDATRDKLDTWTPAVPLLVVCLEEYPGLLAQAEADDAAEGRRPADRVAPRIKRSVRRLIQEGAKVGIRVILIAQRMDASIIGGAERSNLGLRITMRVDNADAVRMLHEGADAPTIDAALNSSQGLGIVQDPLRGLRRFRGDLATYEQYASYVQAHTPMR